MDNTFVEAKFVTMVAAMTSSVNPWYTDYLLGQPMHVIFLAFAGCFVGVWNKNYPTRTELAQAFFTSFLTTVCALVLIPDYLGYKWPNTNVQGAMAMLMGFSSQTWGPRLLEALLDQISKRKEKSQ